MDNLNKRFEGFGKEPSPAVWDRIEQQLDGNKNPVGGWYFFIAACITLALGLGYFISLQNNSSLKSTIISEETKNEITNSKNENLESYKTIDNVISKNTVVENDEVQNENKEESKDEISNQSVVISNKITNIAPKTSLENELKENNQGNIDGRKKMVVPSQNFSDGSSNDSVKENSNFVVNYSGDRNDNGLNSESSDLSTSENNSDNIGSASNRANTESKDEQFATAQFDLKEDLITSNPDFITPMELNPIENKGLLTFKNKLIILPEIEAINQWNYTASYYQGLSSNAEDVVNNYFVTLPEVVTANIQTVEVATTYTNERPIWVNATIGKNIGLKTEVHGGIEYGELKSFLVQSDLVVNKNTNKSIGLLGGASYKIKSSGVVQISVGSNIIIAQSKDNWVRNLPEPTPNTAGNQYFPSTFSTDETFNIELDPFLKVPEIENENLTAYTSEFNATIGIHLNKNCQLNLRPFAKQSLRKKFAGSSAFALPLQYGIGVGIGF